MKKDINNESAGNKKYLYILSFFSWLFIILIVSVWGIKINGYKYALDFGFGLGDLFFIFMSLGALTVDLIGIVIYLKKKNKHILLILILLSMMALLLMLSVVNWENIQIRKSH